MQRSWIFMMKYLMIAIGIFGMLASAQAQYARGNSPYSRYGFGDLSSGMFVSNQTMGGSMAPTYRSYWNADLVNPASLGQLRFTSFQLGLNYEHHELSEANTGLTAQADNGNLQYLSLAFPITKSWEIMKDTLRRGAPVQWGMGFSLTPYSSRNYDVSVLRMVDNIPNVEFKYTGNGNRYRVNWANGVTYKGFSAGANLGLLFGKVNSTTSIDFQDSTYTLGYDEQFVVEENGTGFIWDVGLQYEYILEKDNSNESLRNSDASFRRKIIAGAYVGGVSQIRTLNDQQATRIRKIGSNRLIDTVRNESGVQGSITMPIKVGAGIAIGSESDWKFGVAWESQFWSMYRVNGVADPNLKDSWRVSVGGQWIPNIINYDNYASRIHYRFGLHYGADARSIVAADGNSYQLVDYGLSLGAGFPIRPPKSKGLSGFVNLGFDVGYLGHPELIGDIYFKVNLGFALNAGGWFSRAKFR